jgi:DNA-binding XRE family transcriptional regulator
VLVKTKMKKRKNGELEELNLGPTIRNLRRDCKLTQVEFAHALGVTPASVYRYEAGTTSPSTDTLFKLYKMASERSHGPSEHVFHQIMQGRSPSIAAVAPADSGAALLQAQATQLSEQQLALVLALMRLLSDSTQSEKAVYTVLRALVEPYLPQVDADLQAARDAAAKNLK